MAFGGWGYVGGEGKSARLLRYKFDPCVPQSQMDIHKESVGMQSKQKYWFTSTLYLLKGKYLF